MGLVHARQVGDESMGFRSQAIDGSCRGDVQSPVVLVAPGEICRLLRQDDRSEMVAVRVPQPDPLRARHKNISLLIEFHVIRDTIVLASGFGSKNPSIRERCIRCEIIDANISLLAVVHIEFLAIRRNPQSIRLR